MAPRAAAAPVGQAAAGRPAELARLSLNTATTKALTLEQAATAAAGAGLSSIGLWRDRVQEVGAAQAARIVADHGLRVSSLCRGGFLTAADETAARSALDDNRRAIEEAATVGTRELVMVVGGLPAASAPGGPAQPYPGDRAADPGRDVVAARERVAERIGELAPFAAGHGVRLVLEALHPMFAADRAVISTLGQALDLAEPFPAEVVGVVVDTYHVWWDPDLRAQVARAGATGRIAGYQVCDWTLPLAADPLLSRGHVGDGYVDFASITRWVAEAGYTGDVEVEIFHQGVWDTPAEQTLSTMAERYVRHVLPYL
ncbi:sugar phosphate isomerase/epimerase family protein [Cellulomonas marina]|uniref:Sugar phosphate isomerase/epimerase n=1 Tax=Cellulomonas marina TaxID=988821 RepID=A0A1I1AJP4_9CELL|nr:sugar phosphate isomerase/epimerase family protein [Cellulomonas marina]GIG30152.1 3-dehydroshikimate dehydratase [Cellulomonas marina]SFB38244.1 Sugar phosphate isomerase/epimerase [Cellulomonas marina]